MGISSSSKARNASSRARRMKYSSSTTCKDGFLKISSSFTSWVSLLFQLHPCQVGINNNPVVLEVQLQSPFLEGGDADDHFFGKTGNDLKFVGEHEIVDYEI